MFNKSILVALILCACYLGATQAAGLPIGSAAVTGLSAVNTAEQLTQNLPNLPVGGATGPSLPLVGQLPIGGGNSGLAGLIQT